MEVACRRGDLQVEYELEWKNFWLKESKVLFLYACEHGTMETVKYFIKHGESYATRFVTDAMNAMEHSGVAGGGGGGGHRHIADKPVSSLSERTCTSLFLLACSGWHMYIIYFSSNAQ